MPFGTTNITFAEGSVTINMVDGSRFDQLAQLITDVLDAVSVSQEAQKKIDELTAHILAKSGQISEVVSETPNT